MALESCSVSTPSSKDEEEEDEDDEEVKEIEDSSIKEEFDDKVSKRKEKVD